MNKNLATTIHSNNGYTLMEVLVVVAVIGISVLAWSSMATQLSQSITMPDAQLSRDSLANLIRESIKYDSTCASAVVGVNSSGFTDADILSGTKAIVFNLPGIFGDPNPADDLISGGGIKFKSIFVDRLDLVNAVSVGGGKYFSQIVLQSKTTQGVGLRPIEIGGFYFRVSGGAISSCETNAQDPAPLCVEMGCSWDPARAQPCECSAINLSCPPQQYATGINAAGEPICTPLGSGTCAPGTYLQSISIGASNCVPLPN